MVHARVDLHSTRFFNELLSLHKRILIPLLVPFERSGQATRSSEVTGGTTAGFGGRSNKISIPGPGECAVPKDSDWEEAEGK